MQPREWNTATATLRNIDPSASRYENGRRPGDDSNKHKPNDPKITIPCSYCNALTFSGDIIESSMAAPPRTPKPPSQPEPPGPRARSGVTPVARPPEDPTRGPTSKGPLCHQSRDRVPPHPSQQTRQVPHQNPSRPKQPRRTSLSITKRGATAVARVSRLSSKVPLPGSLALRRFQGVAWTKSSCPFPVPFATKPQNK